MKKLLLTFIAILGFSSLANSQMISKNQFADNFIKFLKTNEFNNAYLMFDSTMKSQITSEKLNTIWSSVLTQFGELDSSKFLNSNPYQSMTIINSELFFQRGGLVAKIVLDSNNKISGFYMSLSQGKVNFKIPDYAKEDSFTETKVEFGLDGFKISGILTTPKVGKKFPVLILVHGSGPNDKDETIGGNKPFRDIAWGLASKGIAVLRYDKRTFTYAQKIATDTALLNNLTLKEETVDDALFAEEFLNNNASNYNLDKTKIYILGHSLGAIAMPIIASNSKFSKGFIFLAGAARPLVELLLEQYNYIFNLDGKISDLEKNKLDNTAMQIENYNKLSSLVKISKDSLPLELPQNYWLDFKKYQFLKLTKTITKPVLVLQGERDYQVTMKDFEIWGSTFKGKKNVTLISYPKLNHLFIYGESKSVPDEYSQSGNVDIKLLNDINDWIIKN